MTPQDQIDHFFEELRGRGRNPLLERTSGTLLVELVDGGKSENWYVTIHRGDIDTSSKGSDPDCTVRTQRSTFLDIISGKLNPMAGLLRGLIAVDGKIALLVALQTFFSPSKGATDQRVAGYAGRRS